jgi:hypothetical protein
MKFVELDFGLRQNLCRHTLTNAALRLGPAFVYELAVSVGALMEARSLLRRLACDVENNPMAPYINLKPDCTLKPSEWYLKIPGGEVAYGSQGM